MNRTSILSIIAVFAMLVGTVATVGNAFAHNNNDNDNDNGGNSADQEISQDQSSEQNSLCVSGDDTDDSCNNFSDQFQLNFGNNALGQDDSDE
jgi:hypothetical protein